MTAALNGSCTACTNRALEFDAALGRCLCRNGGALSVENDIPTCTACESGVLDADGRSCVASCPQTRVLRRSGNRLFCEECPDYAYYDAGLRETVCVSYARCRLGLRMEPRIVYEDGRSLRVCAVPPARTSLMVKGEWLPDASAAVEINTNDNRILRYVQIGTNMFASYDSFADMIRNPNKEAVADNVLTLANIGTWTLMLTVSGETYICNNEYQGKGASAIYIDGDNHFAVRIFIDGDFSCTANENNFCPDAKAIPEAVHEVASVNSEGLVLRLRSGALYYKRNDEWIVDEEAMQVGTLKGSLFRLLRNGTILRDGEVVGEGKHSLLVTNS